jgi:fructose-1,6-bisphosphatase-3
MKGKEQTAKKILELENKLNSYIPTTLWVSDLHGEGDKFARVLRESFGTLFQTCKEALPSFFSEEKVLYIANIIKKKEFLLQENIKIDNQDVIRCLVDVLKYKVLSIPSHYLKTADSTLIAIEQLLAGRAISSLWYDHQWFHKKLIKRLCELILEYFLGHFVILGDIFDRGPDADKIVKIMNIPKIRNNMDLILGNHDILWMGAVAGNSSLVMEAMRISCRYNHQDFLTRMGIDYQDLKKFAVETYPVEKITGNYKATDPACLSMEKALSIMQFKLEEQTILKHPEYEMDGRLLLGTLVQKLQTDKESLRDTHFPTLDFSNPQKLTKAEEEILQNLQEQFFNNQKLKKMMQIFFEKGNVYKTYNSILNIHALIPSNEKGVFEEFLGCSGKQLLDYLQTIIRKVGANYLSGKTSAPEDLALFFYLWCGPKSPFFGKDAMKTLERYFFKDKQTHKEKTLYWEKNLENIHFQKLIKEVFCVEHVVFGHTPRDYNKGQKIASEDGFAINIDGGFAQAYLDKGHALVQTPKKIYAIVLHQGSQNSNHTSPEKVEIIKSYSYPVRVKNTTTANILRKKVDKLLKSLT